MRFPKGFVIVAACLLFLAASMIVPALMPAKALTPQEVRFAGTYSLTQRGASAAATMISFQPDRTCLYTVNGQPIIGLETDWEIVDGELRMANHYRVMPFRNGPLLPGARQTETVIWRLSATADPAIFTIKSPTGLALGSLTRTE